MEFIIEKNIDRTWNLIPSEGLFEGQVVASVEGLNLTDVRFLAAETYQTRMSGALKAIWGLTVLVDDVYNHPDMIRALCLGKAFNANAEHAVEIDSDGVKDRFSLRLLKGAKRVLLLGQAMYTRGQY